MKIAILADIHGNHFGLLQVLKEAKLEGVEQLLILGDIVGYYYYPDKVLEILEDWQYVFIKGNHEDLLMKVLNRELDIKQLEEKYGSGHREAIKKLSDLQIDKLLKSPEKLLINIDGLNILLCHGSPSDANLYLYPDTDIKILNLESDSGADFVLIGHSHYQFMHCGEKGILLNPGSVGQSRSRGGYADWAVINTVNRVVQFRSTTYDTTSLISEVAKNDPGNDYLSRILTRNRN